MKGLNSMANPEMADGLCELEGYQFEEVTGGYQPVVVTPLIFVLATEPDFWQAPPYRGVPSRGVPYCTI
jgi:hypothetical protein